MINGQWPPTSNRTNLVSTLQVCTIGNMENNVNTGIWKDHCMLFRALHSCHGEQAFVPLS